MGQLLLLGYSLRECDRAHCAIAHAFAALDAFVHVRAGCAIANLRERLDGANANGGTRMVLRATAGVYADHGVFGYGLFGFRLTAEHLAPNTVTQAIYLCKII